MILSYQNQQVRIKVNHINITLLGKDGIIVVAIGIIRQGSQ